MWSVKTSFSIADLQILMNWELHPLCYAKINKVSVTSLMENLISHKI